MPPRAREPRDDVQLVVVECQGERLDADRTARAVEAPVPDLETAAALERVDHFLEQFLLLGSAFSPPRTRNTNWRRESWNRSDGPRPG